MTADELIRQRMAPVNRQDRVVGSAGDISATPERVVAGPAVFGREVRRYDDLSGILDRLGPLG